MLGVGINLLTLAIRKIAGALGFYPKTIDQSLRFNDDDSAYLVGSTGTVTNGFTISMWVKRGNLTGTQQALFSTNNAADYTNQVEISFGTTDELFVYHNTGLDAIAAKSNGVLRDPSAWYHIVFSKPQGSAGTLYINGEAQTKQSLTTDNNILTYPPHIGRRASGLYFDGYLAEVHFCDGTAYTADDFGEFKSGVWVAKTPSVTYGTNGFYLDFSNSGALGTDSSGNSNTWTPTNLAATDVMLDSPTNNFATGNPLSKGNQLTLSEGSLKLTASSSTLMSATGSTIGVSSGKWYAEYYVATPSTGSQNSVGISGFLFSDQAADQFLSSSGQTQIIDGGTGSTWRVIVDGVATETVGVFASGDIIGIAFDADALTVRFYLNGVEQGIGSPFQVTASSSGSYYFMGAQRVSKVSLFNFGQDSSFAGTKTPQGNTDANGIGDFYYAPPTGYLALCTANLTGNNPTDTANAPITISGTFTGNANADGPFVYIGGVPETMTINGNAVTFATHADRAANGFKLRTSSASYNAAGSNTFSVSVTGSIGKFANAQENP